MKNGIEEIEHLNRVLQAIRNVNQLIAREKDPDRILQGECDDLTSTRGYYNAWIALRDNSGKLLRSAESGLGKNFEPIVQRLARGELTECARRALTSAGVQVTLDPPTECGDCPLARHHAGRAAMTVRIEHDGTIYGILSAAIPRELADGEEEQNLFAELAGDIAFGLHNIEVEEKRRQAEEELRAAYQQLDAGNQQLRANEQQLRAANQQLRASEQQLRAANQQLNASNQQLRATEEELRAGKQFTENVLDAIQDGISVLDTELNIIQTNRWMKEMYSDKMPLSGKKCYQVYQQLQSPCPWCPSLPSIETGEMRTAIVPYPSPNNPTGWIELTAFPIKDEQGNTINIIEYAKDITRRKQVEKKLEKHRAGLERLVNDRTRELKSAQDQLVQSERLAAIGELAGGVAHELRNSLGVLTNAVAYLKLALPMTDPTVKKNFDHMTDNVTRANKVISDLLDFARDTSPAKSLFPLTELVDEVLKDQKIPGGIKVEKRWTEGINYSVFADRDQLYHIISNLIKNAVEAMTTPGSKPDIGRLTVSCRKDDNGMIVFSVSDTGSGIMPEDKGKIFDPLFTRKSSGIGLGLSISRRYAELNGGNITVESEVGEGSKFIITLLTRRR